MVDLILSVAFEAHAQTAPVAGNLAKFVAVTQGSFSIAYQNVPYQGSVACLNGTGTCTYAVSSGSLPTGITQTGSTGIFASVAGPSGSGTSAFCIVATDSASPAHVSAPICPGITVATLVSITVGPTGQTIPTGTTGFQMTATGTWNNSCPPSGTSACPNLNTLATWAPTTFGTAGTLGLHTGILAAGSAAATPSVTAAFNSITSAGDTVTITGSTPVISNGSLPNGQINQVYPKSGSPAGSNQLQCTGGTGPYTFALASGALPTGFPSLPSSGLISGTATAAGTFTPAFNCTATGGGGTSANKTLNIIIESLSSISALSPAAPSVAQFGTQQFTATCNYSGPSSAPCQPASGVGTISAAGCGANANNSTNVATLASTPACSVNVGDVQVVGMFSDNATTPPYTVPTDTAANTFVAATAQQCQGGASDRCMRTYYDPVTTANAADITTTHFGTATFPVAMTQVKLIGAAASPLDQNGNSNDLGTAGNQATSASITPTVASTMAVFTVSVNGNGRTFTAGTGCTLQVTDPLGFMAMETCPLSGTLPTDCMGTDPCIKMTWSGATTGWGGAISNYKPAAGGSGLMFSATDVSGVNVASINPNSGLATALNAGTSNIKATIGATNSPNDLMTVTAASDSSLTIVCPTGVIVGSNGQCSAKGNVSGTDFTTQATWTSNNTAVLTSLGAGAIHGVANGTTTMHASSGALGGTSASITVSTSGGSSLLSGATVLTDNTNGALSTISRSVPAGWTLVWARGFEGGFSGFAGNEITNFGAGGGITANNFHSGGHAMVGLYDMPDIQVNWILCGNAYPAAGCPQATGIGTFSDVYISFWEYDDPNALYGDSDYFYGGIVQPNPPASGCGQIQDVQIDMQNFSGQQSNTSSNVFVVSEGPDTQATPCMGLFQGQHQMSPGMAISAGKWTQYEIQIHPSTMVTNSTTCLATGDGSDCTGDGQIFMWVNGSPLPGVGINITGADLNGTTSMTNADLGVGGTLTDLSGCGVWATTSCTGTRPGALPPSPFNRYIDDIIILKK